ncbi:hypothetical protein D3C76_1345820 [compost metagenome]
MAWQRHIACTKCRHIGPLLALYRNVKRATKVIEVVTDPISLAIDNQGGAGGFVLEQLTLLAAGAVFDALIQAQAGVLVGQGADGE